MTNSIEKLATSMETFGVVPLERRQLDQRNLQASFLYWLALTNGGYTSDSFFHFFGTTGPREHNILDWNSSELWKKYYSLDETSFVFAEDIFGTQFYFDVRGNRRVVKMLDPDDGSTTLCANTFEDFVESLVFGNEFNIDRKRLASAFYRECHVRFEPFTHISFKNPIVFGGSSSELSNLELIESVDNLMFLGQIVRQTKDLPAGTRIDRIRPTGENT